MKFVALTSSTMPLLVWKPWAPPKCKLFSWLILQKRIWTADRLARRGWQNCGFCKLCNQQQETGPRLLFKCRFSHRVWSNLNTMLGLSINPINWHGIHTVKIWWTEVIHKSRYKEGHGFARNSCLLGNLEGEKRSGVSGTNP
jgi:hypothetical protein